MFKQISIIGTTASGKSALALEIAKDFNAVILSLDSLAIYKYIDIASAKPSKQELEEILHFGVDEISPNEHFSAGKFFEIYKKAKDFALKNGKNLIITGGSGFYLKAMMSGLSPDVPKCEIELSNDEIYKIICDIDLEFANKFSQNDTYRLQKWYQIYKFCNEIPSVWLKNNTKPPIINEIEIFEIVWSVDDIRTRIHLRTQQMIKDGLLDEAKWLLGRYSSDLKPLKSIGLKECCEYLSNKISSIDELSNLISTHTAQLAKRQRTFNRSAFLNKKSANVDDIKKQIYEALNK